MNKYKFALFDWDGCISNTLANAKRILLKLAENNGIAFTDDDLRKIFGHWEAAAHSSGFASVDKYKEEYSKMVHKSILDVELNPNAKELLENLKSKNIPVAIVTTSSREYIISQAEKDRILNLFDKVVGFEDVKNTKPHPEPIYKAIELLAANKNETLMIGDTEKDIIAANSAEVDCVWYNPKANQDFYGVSELEGCEPTYVVDDLIDVEKFF